MDRRLRSEACVRNRDPILAVLREVLPADGLVLEIASGTGMHAVYFAPRLPRVEWQPSDSEDPAIMSIASWREAEPAANLRAPIKLDVVQSKWPLERADAIFVANMLHISPWICTIDLFAGAARTLASSAPLVIYGPFMMSGKHTAPSNEEFDRDLRGRNPRWGVRDLSDITHVAREHGFALERFVEMPANNLTLIFRKK
jgi:hypothetical protein